MFNLEARDAKNIAIVEAFAIIPLMSGLVAYWAAEGGGIRWIAGAAGTLTGLILLRFYVKYIFGR